MVDYTQTAFSRGEVSKELAKRFDTEGYYTALETALNTYVHQYGGISNRAGLRYVRPFRYHDKQARLIEFEFGDTDTHVLEVGDGYMRFLRGEEHIYDREVTIVGVSAGSPAEVTTDEEHGFTTGEEVDIYGVSGLLHINNGRYVVTVTGSNTFTIESKITEEPYDTTSLPAYTSGGAAYRVYTIETPYREEDLFFIKYSQTFDEMVLTCVGYPRLKLRRFALDDWRLEEFPTEPDQPAPLNAVGSANSTGTDVVRYTVTSVSRDTEEESLASLSSGSTFNITDITNDNPAVVTVSSNPGLQTGHEIAIDGLSGGMSSLNGRRYRVTRITGTTYSLQDTDATELEAYESGGTLTRAFVAITNSEDPEVPADLDNTITWDPVPNTIRYVVYRERNGVFGYIGETNNTTFRDNINELPDLQDSAPFFRDPFFGAGNEPAAVGTHAARQVFGGSPNRPARNVFSQTNSFNNFNRSYPLKESDSFSTTLLSNKSLQIRHYVSDRDLIVFTNSTVWSLQSGDNTFWLENLTQREGTEDGMGSSHVKPLKVKDDIIFAQTNSEAVIAMSYQFAVDGYPTKDLNLYSPHLLKNRVITDWAYTPWPEPLVTSTLDDGTALCLTYNPEEQTQVTGWCRWNTDGGFETVASVKAFVDDRFKSVFFGVKRKVKGKDVRFIEVMDSRNFKEIDEAFFVDSGATFKNAVQIQNVLLDSEDVVIKSENHGYAQGDLIEIDGVEWVPEYDEFFREVTRETVYLNGRRYSVEVVDDDMFKVRRLDGDKEIEKSEGFPEYKSGGEARFLVNTIYGLHHLAGLEVAALVDGSVNLGQTVSDEGTVSFSGRTGVAHIGRSYVSDIKTLQAQPERKSLAGRKVRHGEPVVHLYRSRGMLVGNTEDDLYEWAQRYEERMGEPTRLFTGEAKPAFGGFWNNGARLLIRQKDPLPITVRALTFDIEE